MSKEISGPLLFLRYAFVCVEYQMLIGNIKPAKANLLKKHLADGTNPSKSLLNDCFRGAMQGYRESCKKNSCEANLSRASVIIYWRKNHGHTDDCAVTQVTICEINGNTISFMVGSKIFKAINFYNLDLQISDTVYLHWRKVIEKDEELI